MYSSYKYEGSYYFNEVVSFQPKIEAVVIPKPQFSFDGTKNNSSLSEVKYRDIRKVAKENKIPVILV